MKRFWMSTPMHRIHRFRVNRVSESISVIPPDPLGSRLRDPRSGRCLWEGVTQESRRRDPLSSGLTLNPSMEEFGLVQIAPSGEIRVEYAKTTQNSVV